MKTSTKTYTLPVPSVNGVLSDDQMYFEGMRRPSALFQIRDHGIVNEGNIELLEKYFNDLYNLFLRKLSGFAIDESTTIEGSLKLQALLQEMIRVKDLIEAATRAGDERSAD